MAPGPDTGAEAAGVTSYCSVRRRLVSVHSTMSKRPVTALSSSRVAVTTRFSDYSSNAFSVRRQIAVSSAQMAGAALMACV